MGKAGKAMVIPSPASPGSLDPGPGRARQVAGLVRRRA